MGFSRPEEKIVKIKDSVIDAGYLQHACINKTAVELSHVKSSASLSSAIDFAAVDSVFESLTLYNDDFEQAELHPNYGRLEHTDVTDLVIGSYVVCDIIDHSSVRRLKVFGDATMKYDAYIHSIDVTPVGRVTILGCDVEFFDISGTVIVLNGKINMLNLHAGGRVFYCDTTFGTVGCDREVATGKIKLDDPYVLNLLAMNEFEYVYG